MQASSFQRRLLVSPQAFQYICRYGSSSYFHQSAFHRLPRARNDGPATRPRISKKAAPIKRSGEKDVEIRWFEKDEQTGETKQVTRDPEEEEAAQAFAELQEARQSLRKYDADIDSADFHNTVLELFPEDIRSGIAESLRLERERLHSRAESLAVTLESNPFQQPVLIQFNRSLKRAADEPKRVTLQTEVWKWYFRAMRSIPDFARHVPIEAWHVLWDILPLQTDNSTLRESRILHLSDNMLSTGVVLNETQTTQRMESLLRLNRHEQVRTEWLQRGDTPERNTQRYLEDGILLYRTLNDVENSLMLLRAWAQNFPAASSELILPVLQLVCEKKPDPLRTAQALYLLFRDRMGTEIKVHHYTFVIDQLLACQKSVLALAVFVDMLKARDPHSRRNEGTTLEADERRLVDVFLRNLNLQLCLTPRRFMESALPRKWHNKFFFGSWLSSLIGQGNLYGANGVVRLMYRMGIQPASLHVNGIMGARLRAGNTKDTDLAEATAWIMIYQRLQHVRERSARKGLAEDNEVQVFVQHALANGIVTTKQLARKVPMANEETVNVISLHYLLTQQWERLRQLARFRKVAQLRMTAFFLNHLMYMDLHTEGPEAAWQRFSRHHTRTIPDVETFKCLWQASNTAATDGDRTRVPERFPYAEYLFKQMIDWRRDLQPKAQATAAAEFDDELYDRIMTSFLAGKDYAGSIVVMHAIWREFGIAPTDQATAMLVKSLGLVYSGNKDDGRLYRRGKRSGSRMPTAVEQILKGIQERRAQEAQRDGLDVAELDERGSVAMRINVLSELTRTVLGTAMGHSEEFEKVVTRHLKQMGVPDLDTGEIDAFNV